MLHAATRIPPGPGGTANPPFVTGEIIVKFRAGTGLGVAAPLLLSRGERFASITGSPAIDELNRRFGVSSARPVFPAAADALARQQFPLRQTRAPAGARIPSLGNVLVLELAGPDADPLLASRAFAALPEVEYAQPNWRYRLNAVPDDPYYSSRGSWGQDYDDLWGLKRIDAAAAWEISRGAGVVVAVIDTGVDSSHEDLAPNIMRGPRGAVLGYDFSDGDADPSDQNGHGTHVAGTIAAVGDNGLGIVGVAPLAKIMPVKVFPNATTAVCAAGIRFAVDNGADVLNNSWGRSDPGGSGDPLLNEVIDYAHAQGCVVVAAAGNDRQDVAFQAPANHARVIAVASTDHEDRRSDFSNYGRWVSVSAPGGDSWNAIATYPYQNILSLRAAGTDIFGDGVNVVGESYYRLRGTSMAAPHVSGVAALVIAAHPDWGNGLVRGQIAGAADSIDTLNPVYAALLGGGRTNALRGLVAAPQVRVLFRELAVLNDRAAGRLTPGEDFAVAVTLDNSWAPAAGVVASLATSDPLVTITRDTAAFGDLPSGELADNRGEPFLLAVSPDAPFGHQVEFLVRVTAAGYETTTRISLEVAAPYHPGWPRDLPASLWGDRWIHSLADVDRDGADEILVSGVIWRDGSLGADLHIYRADGSELPGWPRSLLADNSQVTAILAGDIDGDGDREVVVSAKAAAGVPNGRIYAWHQESGKPVAGWPVSIGDEIFDVHLTDADDNPRDLELVAAEAGTAGKIHLLQGNGREMPGWPVDHTRPSNTGFVIYVSTASADLDGDGTTEIVVAMAQAFGLTNTPSLLFVHHADGTVADGWPKLFAGPVLSPALGNVDGGGDVEIIVGVWPVGAASGGVYALKSNGQVLQGWPKATGFPHAVLADLDGDARPEVVVGGSSNPISAFDGDGGPLMFLSVGAWSMPSVVDLDGDGTQEFVFSVLNKGTYALAVYDSAGRQLPGMRFPLGSLSYPQPSVGDVDGDGNLEIVTNDYYRLYVIDLPWGKPARLEWPMERHDPAHSNYYEVPGTIRLSSSTYSVAEAQPSARIRVTRVGGSHGAVTVSYATADGSAAAGTDYLPAAGTLRWANGDRRDRIIRVPIVGDSLDEPHKRFTVRLTEPRGGARLGSPARGTVTIIDDDPAPKVQFSRPSSTRSESAATAALDVILSAPSRRTVTVKYATANGTARAGSDYAATAGTLSFAPGETSRTISVPILNDSLAELHETFRVSLEAPSGAILGAPANATVTIVDNDLTPEGALGPTLAHQPQ